MPLKQEGHRARMRRRFTSSGLENFEPREVLELVLFHALPRVDTRTVAIRLLERFGSIDKVLEASAEELQQVEGVGPQAATLLTLFPAVFAYYQRAKLDDGFHASSAGDVQRLCAALFTGKRNEVCYLLCFDSRLKLINTVCVAEGTVNSTFVSNRAVVEAAVKNRAVMAILAHNHPDGTLSPSDEDLVKTKQLMQALQLVGVELCDHIIVANGRTLSLAGAGVIYRFREELKQQ